MASPDVHDLHELSLAIVAAGDQEAVRRMLTHYEAGEIAFGELVSAVRALERPVH